MQSYKLGTSVNPGGGSSNPQPSPATWQVQDSSYGGIKVYDPNAVFQQNPDSNPHLSAQQNSWAARTGFLSDSCGADYSQNQQWNWTNGAQPAPVSNTWSWENSGMHHTSGDYHLQHHCSQQTQLPSYEQSGSVSQPQQIHWDIVQNQNQSAIHRNFSDMWNWGDDSGANTPISNISAIGQESQNDVSHQLRQGPDGQDQWANTYQNWSSIQQNQYSWNQAGQQNYQTPSELPNSTTSWHYSATAAESHGTETSTSMKCRDVFDGKVELESNQLVSTAQPVSNSHLMLQSSSRSSPLEIQATSAQEVSAQDSTSKAETDTLGSVGSVKLEKNDCTGTVATFFQGDGDDEGDIEIREGPQQSMEKVAKQDADLSKVAQPDLFNPPITEPESMSSGGVFNRAPFLRCDSWISNSSLLTYNHSTTGSQEFLSGSFFGEDGPMSISSVTGLCHSIDDMHLTSPKPLHLLHHQHPLLSARRANGRPLLRRRRSSVEEQILSLPLDATNKLDSTPVASDTRRSSLPNVAVLASPETASENLQTASLSNENFQTPPLHSVNAAPQSENVKDAHTEVAQQSEMIHDQVDLAETWAQECATNLEVPLFNPTAENKPSIQTQASDSITADDSGIMLLTENIEVVPSGTVESQAPVTTVNSGSYKMPSWSREGSAFQPLSGRVPKVTPVIQREVPVVLPRTGDLTGIQDDSSQEHLKIEPESANLETVPDNVERPLDGDVSDNIKKIPGRSPLHSSFSRQHLRETHNSSPATSLWENPELAQDFGVVLAPAALPSGSHPVSTQQSALLVPQLQNQQELLDNPLGVSQSSLQAISPKSTSPPSSTVEKRKLDSNIPTVTAVPSTESNEKAATSRSSISPPSAPLDLSSRTAPQGRSAADDVTQVLPVHSAQLTQVSSPQNPSLQNGHPVDGDRQRYMDDRLSNEADRRNQRRSNPADDYSGSRNWNDRNAYVADSGDDYDRRNTRRNDVPSFDRRGERDRTWNERSRDWERDREWQHSNNSYYQYRYDGRSDRERSRPSSRSSNQDYDAGSRDRYYDRSRYPPFEDNVGRDPAFPPRPSSRSGYESDQGSGRHRRPPYEPYHGDYYQQDPRYSAPYSDYYRYAREQYDPRQYSIPYYGANQYNYGYYAELYGSDPRYRAYYDSMAKDYYWQYGGQYRYDDYDRRSVHSGRSSVTDDSRKENEHFTNAFHNEGSSRDQAAEVTELSTIYPPDNMYYPEGVDISANNFEPLQSVTDDVPAVALQRLTPVKFSSPHVRASFNPSGQLIILPPNSIAEGQAAAVEMCDFQGIFSDDPIVQELNNFPSPLIRGETHKNDVIQYCLQKIRKAKEDQNLPDRDSCVLIWELLVLLIRQNGVVVGTDIAELLLHNRDATSEKTASVTDTHLSGSNELLPSNDAAVVSDDDKHVIHNTSIMDGESSQKFIEFLLFGHKKDGLEWAMKRGLWGHALFLASKMDSRTYAMVMTRFANSLAFNDPLQTLYQLMSGRQPALVTCIADEKWGDWRPHLAIILSNPTQRPDLDCRSVITLGDTLAGRGYLHAAHFCYLMAQVEFGSYDKKSSKLVLIGANHSVPFNNFATIEAIKCTEVYEYVQSLANPNYVLPNLQLYKFIYATRLAEHGHPQEALHYCEVIARAIQKMPTLYDVELVRQVYELANRLKYYDPYYTQEEGEVAELGDPLWLRELLALFHSYTNGAVQPVTEYSVSSDGVVMNSAADVSHPHPDYSAQNISSEAGLSGDVQYQQLTNYMGNEQGSSADASHQYSSYYENSQHEMVYSDDSNLQPSNLSRHVNQQNYSEGYSEKPVPQVAEDYSSQNVANSQYDYYGNAISSQVNSTVQEYNDLVDGASSVSPENVDYYSASVYKNSLPPSSTSSEAPRVTTATDHSKPSANSQQQEKPKPKKTEDKGKPKQGGSWLGGIFSKFSLKGPNQMILPDDKNPTMVWDATANKWVSSDGDDECDTAGPVAPPKDMELPTNSGPSPMSAPFPPSESVSGEPEGNRFKLRPVRGMKHNYVDVLGGNTVPVSSKALPPQLLPTVDTTTSSVPSKAMPQFFIPTPAVDSESAATDFVTTALGIQPSSRVANPASRGGSPQDEPEPDDSSQGEIVSPGQPLMFDPSRMDQAGTSFARNAVPAGPRGGLQKYGGRYPR